MIFLERMRESHHQSDKHLNCFKGNVAETSEKWGGAHMGFSEHIDTILNWTELKTNDRAVRLERKRPLQVACASEDLKC